MKHSKVVTKILIRVKKIFKFIHIYLSYLQGILFKYNKIFCKKRIL